jgi:hypothetical protein
MKRCAFIATVFLLAATFGFSEDGFAQTEFAQTWTGRLVDALCKASNQGTGSAATSCAPTKATHLFALELADAQVLNLDAAGNEKADDAIRNAQKRDLRVTVTGSLQDQTVKVATIEIQ